MTCPRCALDWPHLHVTEILRRAGLLDTSWASEDAMQRGTYVHQAIALGNRLDMASLDPDLVGYVGAWRKWQRDTGAVVLASEVPVSHRARGYAGTLDAIVRVHDRVVLLDYKSGGLPASVGPQTAAYRMALNIYGDPAPWRPVMFRAVLQLSKDGSYHYRGLTDRDDEMVFLSALTCAQWQIAHGVACE